MGRYLDLAKEALKDRGRILDGHPVRRIIWETEKAVVFEDEQGRFWRYLHTYRQSWPVVIVTDSQEST